LCELLGNESLKKHQKAKNLNYESEMIMNEMVRAIGVTLEEGILLEAKTSPFFSLILDEATDISVNKQLGLCLRLGCGRFFLLAGVGCRVVGVE